MNAYEGKVGNGLLQWGYLREDAEKAKKAGIDKNTGLPRTSLKEYLDVIFPKVKDWVHDQPIAQVLDGKKLRIRPDYRSDRLKMVVEFDGTQHYEKPDVIRRDLGNTEAYRRLGYKVVRIPYFIQLTQEAVKTLFGVKTGPLFDGKYPSLGTGRGSPACLPYAGLKRMARVFLHFPEQYKVNVEALEKADDDFLTGVSRLEKMYAKVAKNCSSGAYDAKQILKYVVASK